MRHGVPTRVVALLALGGVVALAACTAPQSEPERLILIPVSFSVVPGWTEDDHSLALQAFRHSCVRLAALSDSQPLGPDRAMGTGADWREPCEAAALSAADRVAARIYFETWFVPFRASNGTGHTGLFTGYYEPELRGARTRGGTYSVPLYRRPGDLVTVDLALFREDRRGEHIVGRVEDGALRPYASRAEIESGALVGEGLELLWVDDAIDAFFLHVQGSGRVMLEDGRRIRIGFAGHNGHRYVAIGRELVRWGELTATSVTLQSIKAWLRANPDRASALMTQNPRFVFFRELSGDGPLGAQGVPLTPGRSLAVDKNFISLGTPVWLHTTWPGADARPLRRLMVAQDAGGAIRGPVRGDLFLGHGKTAEDVAGRMRQVGMIHLLLPRRLAALRMASN